MNQPDPLERQRKRLSGEIDSDEARQRKIAEHQSRLAKTAKMRRLKAQQVPENAKRLVDPIERRKQKLTESLKKRRASERQRKVEPLPKHLVVVVRKLADPPPRPKPKPKPKPEPKPPEDAEDFITRRLREARERLKGK